MKRKTVIMVAMTVVVCLIASIALAADPIKLVVNGKEVQCDTPPQIVNDRTLVPIRAAAEALEAEVNWDGDTKTVFITSATKAVEPVKPTKPEKDPEELRFIKLDGDQTAWPYWYENDQLYVEWRAAVHLARMSTPFSYYNVNYYPDSQRMVRNNKFNEVRYIMKGDFKVISLNKLQEEQFVNFEFDPETENLKVFPIQ